VVPEWPAGADISVSVNNFIAMTSDALQRIELLLPHNPGRSKKTSGHDVAKFEAVCDELGIFGWSRTR